MSTYDVDIRRRPDPPEPPDGNSWIAVIIAVIVLAMLVSSCS